jgi:ATP-dependent DNA ligase
VKARGLEGIIGKKRGSLYEVGRRSGTWIKLKCVNEQEFVIGGYTPPQGSRNISGRCSSATLTDGVQVCGKGRHRVQREAAPVIAR